MGCSNLFLDWIVHNIFHISQLSDPDFALIVGQFNHSLSGSKEEIDPSLSERGYSPEAIAAAKKKVAFNPIVSCGLRFTKHLSNYKYPLFTYVVSLFQNYEKGNLPFEGPVSDQPAQIMEIFSVFEHLRAEQQSKINQKLEENVRRKRQDSARTR